jgi:hypothetical protein
MSTKSLVPINAMALSFAPSTPSLNKGDIYFNTITNTLQVWTGSTWQAVGSGAGGGDPLPQTFLLMGA